VLPSVQQWYDGQTNNGFILFSSWFEGGGNTVWSEFLARESSDTAHRPALTIAYTGAQNCLDRQRERGLGHRLAQLECRGAISALTGTAITSPSPMGPRIRASAWRAEAFSPGSVTINNSSTTYSFSSGSINGGGGLIKQGPGRPLFQRANGYGGLTLIQGGQLVVAANGALARWAAAQWSATAPALGFQGGVTYSAAEPMTISGGGGGGGALYAVSGNNTFAGR